MKKLIALLLAVVFLSTGLVGCGGADTKPTTKPGGATPGGGAGGAGGGTTPPGK